MRVLLTNDDGVQADGLYALKNALAPLADVTVCAPERPRSAAGHAITLHKPLRVTAVTLRDGSAAYGVSGTPADCVILGAQAVMGGAVDLVVSGINHGPNLGWDVHYSGTVAAAKEAAMIGLPAVAISTASYAPDADFGAAAAFAARLARWLAERPDALAPRTVLNVNVPSAPADAVLAVEVAAQGPRQYVDRYERRADPSGRDYYWLGGTLATEAAPAGTDGHAVAAGRISVTPLQLDLTAPALLAGLKGLES